MKVYSNSIRAVKRAPMEIRRQGNRKEVNPLERIYPTMSKVRPLRIEKSPEESEEMRLYF